MGYVRVEGVKKIREKKEKSEDPGVRTEIQILAAYMNLKKTLEVKTEQIRICNAFQFQHYHRKSISFDPNIFERVHILQMDR